MNYKDTKPYMLAFLSVDLLTYFAAFCLTDFINWRYIHLWLVFLTELSELVNCCRMDEGTILVYCCPSTVPPFWPPPSSPLPNVQYMQTVCDCGGGGEVEVYCGPYSAGVLHSVSDHIQNLQNCFTTPNKITSKDDIKGLVSLRFLRPCAIPTGWVSKHFSEGLFL